MTQKAPKQHIQWIMQLASVVILLSMLLSACGTPATATEAPTAAAPATEAPTVAPTAAPATEAPTAAPAAKYKEAPMLAQLVASGALPAVDQRLPKNPRVLNTIEKVGTYGGTWHRAYSGIGDRWNVGKLFNEHIVKYYPVNGNPELQPNWIDSYKLSSDATTYTFHIREGLKWSDGQPVTTDDAKFWYEDIYLNTDLNPNPATFSNGKPLVVEVVDQYTFNVKFAGPNPLFLTYAAQNSDSYAGLMEPGFIQPAHYLKKFLPKYTSQADLDKIVADKQVKSWKELWGGKGAIYSEWLNPDKPTLSPWIVKTPPPAEHVVWVRNPYYYAVDQEGNQLPYIDEVTFDLFQDQQTVDLWVVQGKLDELARGLSSASIPLYKQNEAQGNYKLLTWRSAQMQVIMPNLNVADPILNKLFNDINFRQALNISINRDEVQQIAWNGFGAVRQASPVPGTPYYDAEFSSKWTNYDPAAANKLLDDLGLTKKDGDGYRLREDGKRLSINLLYVDACNFCELVQKYWKDVGIELLLKKVDRSLFDTTTANAQQDMIVWWWDRNNMIEADPSNYLGTDGLWAPLWGKWALSEGKEGQEPPADHPIRQLWDLWKKATSTSDPAEAKKDIQQIVTIHKENVWVIGLVGEDPSPIIVSTHMHNVPDGLVYDEAFREEGLTNPAQFFLDNAK